MIPQSPSWEPVGALCDGARGLRRSLESGIAKTPFRPSRLVICPFSAFERAPRPPFYGPEPARFGPEVVVTKPRFTKGGFGNPREVEESSRADISSLVSSARSTRAPAEEAPGGGPADGDAAGIRKGVVDAASEHGRPGVRRTKTA